MKKDLKKRKKRHLNPKALPILFLLAVIIILLAAIALSKDGKTELPSESNDVKNNQNGGEISTVPENPTNSTDDENPTEKPLSPSEVGDNNETGLSNVPSNPSSEILPEAISLTAQSVTLSVGESFMPIVTMSPENAEDKGEIWTSDNTEIATVNEYGRITAKSAGSCTVTVKAAANQSVSASVAVTVNEATEAQLTYIDGILIANKSYPLPSDYNPGVDKTAQSALDEMIKGASKDNISLWICSGFRSYSRQKTLYDNYVRADGVEAADRYSARPGHSEHQTGLAFDLNSVDQSFADTTEGKWLAEHCHEYGFIIRYPKGKEEQTGYMYEPWHVRYLGTDTAKKVFDSGLSLEEYLGITSRYAD